MTAALLARSSRMAAWQRLPRPAPVASALLAMSAAAWLALGVTAAADGHLLYCGRPGLAQLDLRLDALVAGGAVARQLGQWALMVVAMMSPVALPMGAWVGARSAWRRRGRSEALFIAGYLALWLALGLAFAPLALALGAALDMVGLGPVGAGFAFAAAAAFQLTSAKGRLLNRCHGTVPLRAFGRGADADALRFGLVHGWRCARACAPAMAALAVGGHSLPAMAVVTMAVVRERRAFRPSGKEAALLLVLAGVLALLAGG